MNESTPLRCSQAEELLALRQDASLDIFQAKALEEHLTGCPHCRAFADDLQKVQRVAQASFPLPLEEVRLEGVVQTVMDRISTEQDVHRTGHSRVLGRWIKKNSKISQRGAPTGSGHRWQRFWRPLWGVPSLVSAAAAVVLVMALLRSSLGPSPVPFVAPSPPSPTGAASSRAPALSPEARGIVSEEATATHRESAPQTALDGVAAMKSAPSTSSDLPALLAAVGELPPQSVAQRDSLITRLTQRRQISRTADEREALDRALRALQETRP